MARSTHGIAELLSDFPGEEYVARWEKAQELMERAKVDGILLARAENIAYYTGWRKFLDISSVYFMLPRKGKPTLVAPHNQKRIIEVVSPIEDVRYFGPSSLGFNDLTHTGLKVLRELGFTDKVVGLESNPQVVDQTVWDSWTKGHLRRKKVVDELIWRQRLVKSILELRYVRRVCDITCKAYTKALAEVCEGMTEREFTRILYRTMVEEGAFDSPLLGFAHVAASPKYGMHDVRATDYKFQKKDTFLLDAGATYRGYWCDMTRVTCIGQPSKRQRKLFDVSLEAELEGLDMLRPGVKISEVCKKVKSVIEKHGMVKNMGVYSGTDWYGHSLGLEVHERPDLVPSRPDSDVVLEPGMVFAIEPAICDDPIIRSELGEYKPGGEGYFFVEDNVLVTEYGPENLTPIPRELNVV
jgi:Xaa-Pro aminopeptidase